MLLTVFLTLGRSSEFEILAQGLRQWDQTAGEGTKQPGFKILWAVTSACTQPFPRRRKECAAQGIKVLTLWKDKAASNKQTKQTETNPEGQGVVVWLQGWICSFEPVCMSGCEHVWGWRRVWGPVCVWMNGSIGRGVWACVSLSMCVRVWANVSVCEGVCSGRAVRQYKKQQQTARKRTAWWYCSTSDRADQVLSVKHWKDRPKDPANRDGWPSANKWSILGHQEILTQWADEILVSQIRLHYNNL